MSNYPGSIDTNTSLYVTADNVQSTLASAVSAVATSITVADATGFAANMIVTIADTISSTGKLTAYEHVLCTAVIGNVLSVSRHFAGTAARTHSSGKLVSVLIDSAHQLALKQAVIAIENVLGVNGSNMTGNISVTRFNFTPQTPGGNLVPGANAITLTPVPQGINGTNLYHYVYISGGTGVAEACLITGGAAVGGDSSGQIIITCANAHSGAWTIQSATAGIQETLYSSTNGQTLYIPPGTYPIYGTIAIGNGNATQAGWSLQSTYQGMRILGSGAARDWVTPSTTKLQWQGASGSTMLIYHGPVAQVELAYMALDGNNLAGNIIQSLYGDEGFIHDLLLGNSKTGAYFGFRADFGCGANIFSNIHIVQQQSGTSCMGMGYQPTAQGCSQNKLMHVYGQFPADTSTSYGLVLSAADNNCIEDCDFQGSILTVAGASNSTPIVISSNVPIPGLATGQKVAVLGVTGNTAANNTASNPVWTITKIDSQTFSLNGSSGNGGYGGGGSINGPGYALAFITNGNEPLENTFVGGAYFNALSFDDDAGHGANQIFGISTGDGFLVPPGAGATGLIHPDYYTSPDAGAGWSRLLGRLKVVDSTNILGYMKMYPTQRRVAVGENLEAYTPSSDFTVVRSTAPATIDVLSSGATDSALIRLRSANGNYYRIETDQTNNYFKIASAAGDIVAFVPGSLVPVFFSNIQIGGAAGPSIKQGTGSPNSAVVGSPGDIYLNKSGGASTTLYVKESGSATNTGWVAK